MEEIAEATRDRYRRGRALGLCEPRCERQPRAPAILSDMRNACIHSKRGAVALDRRPRRYTRRSRDRQARHDHLDFERTELGRIRSKYPNSPSDERAGKTSTFKPSSG